MIQVIVKSSVKYHSITIEMKNKTQVQGTIKGTNLAAATLILENAYIVIKDPDLVRLKVLINRTKSLIMSGDKLII